MDMMAATHSAASMAGSFLFALFLGGIALFFWAKR
jgi:hypothetical protein